MYGGLECALGDREIRSVTESLAAVRRYDSQLVQVVFSQEWQVEWRCGTFARHVDASHAIEDAVHARVLPKLVDRNERVGEGRYAAHVSDKDAPPHAVVISSECGEISDAFHALRLAVDARHGVAASASVDEVGEMRMTMP